MKKTQQQYSPIERAIEAGLKSTFNGEYRVNIRRFKPDDNANNPFCTIYPFEIVVFEDHDPAKGRPILDSIFPPVAVTADLFDTESGMAQNGRDEIVQNG